MKNHTIIGICGIVIGVCLTLFLSAIISISTPQKNTGFKMLQYNVEPACINHLQYYAVGDMNGLHAVTPVFTKEGKTLECNFEIGK